MNTHAGNAVLHFEGPLAENVCLSFAKRGRGAVSQQLQLTMDVPSHELKAGIALKQEAM